MGTFIRKNSNVNVPAGTPKDPIKRDEKRSLEAKVNNIYKL